MASEQMRRGNVSDERSIEVERDKVPKMATHFESLAEKAKEGLSLRPHGEERVEQYETRVTPSQVKGIDEEQGEKAQHEVTGQRVGSEMLTGEEERGVKDQETKHQVGGESEERESPNLEEISSLRQTAQQKSIDAVNAAQERYERAKAAAAQQSEALKGATVEKGQQAKDLTAQKAAEAKDVISSKVGAVKDTTVEIGKGAAGYAADVAEKVKDRAVVAGWGATHYTLEKVAEATKAVAGATASVAGYTGEKGGAVKEKVVEKIAAAKDAVVGMEEKGEGERGLEEKGEAHDEGKVEVGEEQYKIQHQGRDEQPEQEENRVQEEAGGGVLQAIGETIVEIGQTTKDILAGQYPAHVLEPKEEEKDYDSTAKD